MSNILLRGILPAMITPLSPDGTVLCDSIGKILDRNYAQGAAGFYICGSTGEGPVLPAQTRMQVAQTVMDRNNGRGIIVNHVGAASPEEAFMLARHAKAIGCDAVSSVVPNFYYRYNEEEITDYYRRLADAAELPVIAYAQGLLQSDPVSLMEKLMKIDGVAGVKFTLTDFYALHRIKELNGGDINVINGPDEMLLCGLCMGADAGIGSTYNLMCGEFCRLFAAFEKGELSLARETQYKINRIIEILIRFGVIRSIKFVLGTLGIPSGDAAFPQKPLTPEEQTALRTALEQAEFYTAYNL